MKNTSVSNHGFTLVEVLVSLGLVGILILGLASTQSFFKKDQNKLTLQLSNSIDESLAERILFDDFSSLEASYNNITVKDDSNRTFFDFFPDIPGTKLTSNTALSRSIKINAGSAKKLTVLVQDISKGPVFLYDPPAAYEIGSAPDIYSAAPLTFKGLNYKNWVSKPRPRFWENGVLLMLDSPAKLRPIVGGQVDLSIPPRSHLFIGKVDTKSNKLISVGDDPNIKSFFDLTLPDNKNIKINSEDQFLRRLPAVGGGQPLVRLRAVKLMQYYLVVSKDSNKNCFDSATKQSFKSGSLYRANYKNGKFEEAFMLADKVCAFEIFRDSVMKRMVYFNIKKESLK